MKNHEGSIAFDAYINSDLFKQDINKIKSQISGLEKHSVKEADKMNRTFQNLGRLAAGAFAGLQLSSLTQQIVKVRGEFQQLEISFTTMLGSKAKADKLMAEITEFAAQTPYGLSETANATKTLIAYGAEADTVIDRLRKLGDIAAGVGAPLSELTKVYGQVMVNGRMETERLNQFLDRGIPMISELAKVLGVAENEVKKMVEQGKVGFPQLEQAIDNLTKKGAMFGGLMEEQSKSIVGLQAALGDAIDSMLNDLGKSQEGIITTLYQGAITAVENYEKVIDVLKVVVSAYGAYRAAIILTAAYQNRANIAALINGYIELAKGLRKAAAAQALLNKATLANPYVLAATALGALVAGIVVYNKETDRLTKANAEAAESFAEESAKVKTLVSDINNENLSRNRRNKALSELKALQPDILKGLTLENTKTEEGKKALDAYIESLRTAIKEERIRAELSASYKREELLNSGQEDLPWMDVAAAAIRSGGSQAEFSKQLAKASNEYVAAQVAAEKAIQQQLESELGLSTITRKPLTPTGPPTETKKAAEKEKEIRIKTFQDELDEKRGMYELYERWIQHVGREAAEKQFQDLRKGGENYMDWLNSQIVRLEQLRDFQYAGFSDQDKSDLDRLLTERGQLQGEKSGIEVFTQDLANAKDEAQNLVEYLQFLKAVQQGLSGDDSLLGSEKRLVVAGERLSIEKDLKKDLQDFLRSVEGSEARRLEITGRYAQKRAALEQAHQQGKIKDYKKALAAIDAAEKKEIQDDEEQVRKKSAEYKALLKIAEKHQNDLTKLDVEAAREQFKRLTENLDKESDEYKEHYENLLNIEKSFQQKRIEALYAIGDVAVQIGDVMRGLDGDIGNVGNVISAIGSQVIAVAQTIEKINKSNKSGSGGKFNIQDITSIVSLITQLVGLIVNRVKMLGDEFESFIESVLKLQQDQATQRNDQLGKNYSDNPFISDYTGMIKAGVDQYRDALKQYNEAIAALDDGNAITGYRGGFWRKKKNRFITDDLLETYPELIDSAGNLNRELAQTLINTNMIDDATKRLLESAIAWSDQMEAANDQFMSAILDMTGMIGNDLADAMVNAFKAGEDGAKAMGNVLGRIIEDFVNQTVILDILRPLLDEFREGVKDSYAPGGDGTIIDDLARLNGKLPDAANIANEVMAQMREYGKANGMSIFESAGSEAVQASTRGHTQGVTEQTVSVLVGQFNAVRIYNAQIAGDTRASLLHLAQISYNTSFNRQLGRLEAIESTLRDIKAQGAGRSAGL